MLSPRRGILLLLIVQLTTSDLICKTTGNVGCNLSCSLSSKGKGSCTEKEKELACVCGDSLPGKVNSGRSDSESFWADVDTDTDIDVDTDENLNTVDLSQDYFKDDTTDIPEEFVDKEDIENEYSDDQDLDEQQIEDLTEKEDGDENYLSWILRKLIFFPAERKGLFGFLRNIKKPSTYGLKNAVNFRIPCENGSLGAWFIYPEGSNKTSVSDLDGDNKLIVYVHGSSATRGYSHRVNLYRMLSKMGYHVLTFDYRGYADSSPVKLSEDTVVADSLSVFTWLNSTISNESRPLVLLWSHSLGTSIASHSLMLWEKNSTGIEMSGLILESPFSTMADEIQRFSLTKFVSKVVGKNHSEILKEAKAEFLTTVYLPQVEAPTLILHADNDRLVPSYLGERLYKASLSGGKKNVRFILFPADLRLGHKYIYTAPGLTHFIKDLEEQAIGFRKRFQISDVN